MSQAMQDFGKSQQAGHTMRMTIITKKSEASYMMPQTIDKLGVGCFFNSCMQR